MQIKKVKTERVELYIDAQSSCFGIHEFKRPPFVCSKTFSTRFKLFRPSRNVKLTLILHIFLFEFRLGIAFSCLLDHLKFENFRPSAPTMGGLRVSLN